MKYTIVSERSATTWPARKICLAASPRGAREETAREMLHANPFHIERLHEHGEPMPEVRCTAAVVVVDVTAAVA